MNLEPTTSSGRIFFLEREPFPMEHPDFIEDDSQVELEEDDVGMDRVTSLGKLDISLGVRNTR